MEELEQNLNEIMKTKDFSKNLDFLILKIELLKLQIKKIENELKTNSSEQILKELNRELEEYQFLKTVRINVECDSQLPFTNETSLKRQLSNVQFASYCSMESISSQDFSNVTPENFQFVMNQLKYRFVYEARFHSFSNNFRYDKQRVIANQEESITREKLNINFPIDYKSGAKKYLDEKEAATPIIIKYLNDLLVSELNLFEYKMIDVSSEDNCIFTIPLYNPYYSKGNDEIKGKTKAVIVPKKVGETDISSHVCVGFEFKTTIFSIDSHHQLLLELLGAISARSNTNLPILFVLTDLSTFKFVWLHDLENKIIRFYQTRDLRYAIDLIKEFIDYHRQLANQRQPKSLVQKSFCFFDWLEQNGQPLTFIQDKDPNELKAKVEDVYNRYSKEGILKHVQIAQSVYKIEIDNQSYIMKVDSVYSEYSNFNQLRKEHEIYEYFLNLRKEVGDCIPEIYYAGFILDGCIAIVTKYIEGRHPSWENECDREVCSNVLARINDVGVLHGDARERNFIIVEREKHTDTNDQCIGIDIEESAIILDFGRSVRLYRQLQEDLISSNTTLS